MTRCGSPSSARAACRPTTAASRHSPRSSARGSPSAGTRSPSTAATATSPRGLRDLSRHAPRPPAGAALQVPRDGRPQPVRGVPRARPPVRRRLRLQLGQRAGRVVLRPLGRTVVLNVDGLEWQRAKWSALGRRLLPRVRLARGAAAHPRRDRRARSSRTTTARPTAATTEYFPYGTDLEPVPDDGTLARLGLEPRRLRPVRQPARAREQRPRRDRGLRAGRAPTCRSSIVGDAPYASRLHRRGSTPRRSARPLRRRDLRRGLPGAALACDRLRAGDRGRRDAPGARRGDGLRQRDRRQRRARASRGARRRGPLLPGPGRLARPAQRRARRPALADTLRGAARDRAAAPYSWDAITDAYEAWLASPPLDGLTGGPRLPTPTYTPADAEDGADHRHHRPGRLVPRRIPARRGLPRRRDDPPIEHRRPTSGSPISTVAWNSIQGDLLDQASLVAALRDVEPDEVYNLAAQSFVPTSWNQPVLTGEFTALGVTRMLEAIRQVDPAIRFYQASSSEMFGKVREVPQTELDAVPSAQPVRRRQGVRALPDGELPRELRPVCGLGDPVQPRIAAARPRVRDAQGDRRRGAHRARAGDRAAAWATSTPSATGASRATTCARCG